MAYFRTLLALVALPSAVSLTDSRVWAGHRAGGNVGARHGHSEPTWGSDGNLQREDSRVRFPPPDKPPPSFPNPNITTHDRTTAEEPQAVWQLDGQRMVGIGMCVPVITFFWTQLREAAVPGKDLRPTSRKPEAVLWWLGLPMFIHAATHYFPPSRDGFWITNLRSWSSIESIAFMMLVGFQHPGREILTYVGALGVVLLIGNMAGFGATSEGINIISQLFLCLVAEPIFLKWSQSLGQLAFLVGWFWAFVGIVVQACLTTKVTESLVWLIFGANVPAFFMGLSLVRSPEREDTFLGIGLLACTAMLLSTLDAAHVHLVVIQDGFFVPEVSKQVAAWFGAPLLAGTLMILTSEQDILRRIFEPLQFSSSVPIAQWALLPCVEALAKGFSRDNTASHHVIVAAFLIWLVGTVLDGIVLFLLNKLASVHPRFAAAGPGAALLDAPSKPPPKPVQAWPKKLWIHQECLAPASKPTLAARPAITCAEFGTSLTYAEYRDRVHALAASLFSLKLGDDAAYGVVTERNYAMAVGLISAMLVRGFCVPIEPIWPRKRQEWCMEKMEVQVVLADNCPREVNSWGDRPIISINASDGRLLAGAPQPVRNLPELLSQERSDTTKAATIVWTSGSTGFPKAVIYSHNSVAHGSTEIAKLAKLDQSCKSVMHSPFVWATLEWQLFTILMVGGECVLAKPGCEKDPGYLADLVQRSQTTFFTVTPPLLDKMLDSYQKLVGGHLRDVIAVGTALPMACVRRFHKLCPGIFLHNAYGASETAMTCWTTTDEPRTPNAPVGQAQDYAGILLLDAKDNIIMEEGVKGQIVFTGILQSYGHASEEDQKRFRTLEPYGRVYMSGDVGCWGKFGLEVFGRMDRQVQVNGIRVEPAEIEVAAKESDADVRDAICVIPDDGGAAVIILFVSPANVDTELVKTGIKQQKPHYMVPSLVKAIDHMPMLPNGKFDNRELMAQAEHLIASSAVTIIDSLGQIKTVSKASAELQGVVECGYAFGMICTVFSHWFDCELNECDAIENTHPAVQFMGRYLIGADFYILVFLIGSAILDHVQSTRATLGIRELVCFIIWWFIGWPLCTFVHFLIPWENPCSIHRWYLMMYVVSRVYLSCAKYVMTKGESTALIGLFSMFSYARVGPQPPYFTSDAAWFFGLMEDCGELYNVYDRKFLMSIFIYVVFFHYGMPVAKQIGSRITPQNCWVLAPALYMLMLAVHPRCDAMFMHQGNLLQGVMELAANSVMSGLFLGCFVPYQPKALRWLGQNALAGFIVHAIIPVRQIYWTNPHRTFDTLAAKITSPFLAIPIESIALVAYPVGAMVVGWAVFQTLGWLWTALKMVYSLFRPREETSPDSAKKALK